MKHGKQTCRILKEIRKEIAKANDIEFMISECQHKGDCPGTCLKCEAEVRYLEKQLERRRLLGKAVTVMGVSMGLSSLTACVNQQKDKVVDEDIEYYKTEGEAPLLGDIDTIPEDTVSVKETIIMSGYVPMTADTVPPADGIYLVTEEMPEFPGGMAALAAFIRDKTRYPDNVEKQIEGRVTVQFVVQPDGSSDNPQILRSLGPDFDEEALRIVSLFPKWKPGRHLGENVPVKYTIPVMFQIPEK